MEVAIIRMPSSLSFPPRNFSNLTVKQFNYSYFRNVGDVSLKPNKRLYLSLFEIALLPTDVSSINRDLAISVW